MGLMQKRKGAKFERRIANELRKAFPSATVRRSSQAHKAHEPDVVIEGDAPELVKRLWLELTDSRNPQPLEKLAQAEQNARERSGAGSGWPWCPVALCHRTGARHAQVTLRLGNLMELMRSIVGFRGIPVTLDWEQFLDALYSLQPAQETA